MKKLKKELSRFLLAGISAVGTDLIIYYILFRYLGHDIAKGTSFLAGTVVAYIINKYWTFEKHTTSYSEVARFFILYSITLIANIGTNKLILSISNNKIFLAFLIATGISTIMNFCGQKWWVFK